MLSFSMDSSHYYNVFTVVGCGFFFFVCVCVTGVSVCMLGTWTHSLCIGYFPIKLYCSVNVIIPVAYHIIVLFAFVTLYL